MSDGELGLVPVTDDPDTAGFFAAAAERRLVVQTCADCGNRQQPPRPRCVSCHGTALEWRDIPGRGRVHSWTVVEHQISLRFPVPYTVVLVDVVPGEGEKPVRFLGHLPGRAGISIGDGVHVVFQTVAEGVTLPNWERDDE